MENQTCLCRIKQILLAGLSFWFAAAGSIPASANQIKEVRIRLEAESFDENGWPCVEAYCASEKYTVTGIERIGEDPGSDGNGPAGPQQEEANEKAGSREEDEAVRSRLEREAEPTAEPTAKPAYEIELTSEEEDGFAVMKQNNIRFYGLDAVCTKAVRKDSGQTLLLTMILEAPGEIVGEIGGLSFHGASASWEAAPGASSYLVMLYRSQKRVGYSHRTAGLSYDFSPLIKKPGSYCCKVYPLTESGKRGAPAESCRKQIEEDELAEIQKGWEASPAGHAVLSEAADMASEKGKRGSASGWYTSETQKFYLEKDGGVPQENWLFLDGAWYYFDRTGAAKTDCWQEWKGSRYYLGETGKLENETDAPENETDAPENEAGAPENEADTPENEADTPENGTDASKNETDTFENELDAPERKGEVPERKTQAL